MKTSERGLALIKLYEGCSLTPYICAAGYPTIGYGHVITIGEAKRFAGGISMNTAELLLKLDLYKAEQAVMRHTKVPLTQSQFDALVSFVFNLGGGRYGASTLRQKLNRSDYSGAAGQFPRWVYAAGKKLVGLVRRRAAEKRLFEAS